MPKYLTWKNYLRFLRAKGPVVVAPLLAIWERSKIEHYGNQPLKHPPIFIIGAPRTGSTISYQIFSNLFDVAYCTSLVDLLYRNFFFGFVLSNALYGSAAHNVLENSYGKAVGFSPKMPTEAGYLWGRWLPRDKHFMEADEVSARKKAEIRRDITSISNYLEKPLLFKNLLIGQRLRLIHEIFPDAKIILLSRNQVYTTQSILLMSRLSNALYGSAAHNVLENSYGKAVGFSPKMPTEAGYLWGRWLPRDKHFMEADEVSARKKAEIRRDITSISNYLEKPLLFKNLLIGQRLRLIHEIFPDAKIILLSRNQVYTTQSILLARAKFNVPKHQMWSIRPPNFEELERLGEVEMVARQAFFIDKQMRQDSALFDSRNVLEVSYESLELLDEKMVREWAVFLGAQCRRDRKIHVPSIRNKQKVDDETFNRILAAVENADSPYAVPADD